MIKKEITDKDNQLCYNLCENKDQMIASIHSFTSFTRSLQQSLTFFRINYPTCQSIISIPQFDGINIHLYRCQIISV